MSVIDRSRAPASIARRAPNPVPALLIGRLAVSVSAYRGYRRDAPTLDVAPLKPAERLDDLEPLWRALATTTATWICRVLERLRSVGGAGDAVRSPRVPGQGIGSTLMDAVEARLAGIGVADLTITVIARNAEASPFYERRGAVPFITEFVQPVQRADGATSDFR